MKSSVSARRRAQLFDQPRFRAAQAQTPQIGVRQQPQVHTAIAIDDRGDHRLARMAAQRLGDEAEGIDRAADDAGGFAGAVGFADQVAVPERIGAPRRRLHSSSRPSCSPAPRGIGRAATARPLRNSTLVS